MTLKEWLRWVFLRKTSQNAIVIDYNKVIGMEIFIHEGHKVIFRGRIETSMLSKDNWTTTGASVQQFTLEALSTSKASIQQ